MIAGIDAEVPPVVSSQHWKQMSKETRYDRSAAAYLCKETFPYQMDRSSSRKKISCGFVRQRVREPEKQFQSPPKANKSFPVVSRPVRAYSLVATPAGRRKQMGNLCYIFSLNPALDIRCRNSRRIYSAETIWIIVLRIGATLNDEELAVNFATFFALPDDHRAVEHSLSVCIEHSRPSCMDHVVHD